MNLSAHHLYFKLKKQAMKTLELKGQKRDNTGKRGSKDLRNEEMVPCVIYGGTGTIHFSADLADLKNFIYSPEVYFAQINVDGNSYKGVMKEVQFHPVTDMVNHVDFFEVSEDKKVKVSLPIKTVGNSVGVRGGGKLIVNIRKLTVEALPKDLPDYIEIDISDINIGDKLRVSDLNVKGVSFLDAGNVVVATVRITRNIKADEPEAAKATATTTAPAPEAEAETKSKSKK